MLREDAWTTRRQIASTSAGGTSCIKALCIRTLLMDEMAAVLRACDVMVVLANTALPGTLELREVVATDVKPGSSPTRFRRGNTFRGNSRGGPRRKATRQQQRGQARQKPPS